MSTETLILIGAPALGVVMDWLYYESMIHIIHGYLSGDRRYSWRDFASPLRIAGIVIASLGVAIASIYSSLTVVILSAAVYCMFHFYIYYVIYEDRSRPSEK